MNRETVAGVKNCPKDDFLDLLSTSVFSAVIEDLGNLSALLRHLYHAFIELSSVSSRRSEGALFHFVRYVTLAEHKGLMWGSLVQSELARQGQRRHHNTSGSAAIRRIHFVTDRKGEYTTSRLFEDSQVKAPCRTSAPEHLFEFFRPQGPQYAVCASNLWKLDLRAKMIQVRVNG